MGEAKLIVKGDSNDESVARDSVLGLLDDVLDDIDSALQVKLNDLFSEGKEKSAENHYKIGLMRGADALIRRAVAMLEDCYAPLDTPDEFADSEDDDALNA